MVFSMAICCWSAHLCLWIDGKESDYRSFPSSGNCSLKQRRKNVRKILHWTLLIALLSGFLVACGATEAPPEPTEPPAATEPTKAPEEPEPAAEEKTVVIGFTTSQTGSYNVSSTRQVNGLLLWMNEVNDAGGIALSDGTVVKFDYVTYDDESTKERVQELYTRLATEDNADFLISPYSSGLTAAAALIAEQNGKIMITTGAASDDAYKQGYSLVFQAYTPASRYLTGAADLLAMLDPEVKQVAFVYENTTFATSVVEAAKVYAEELGYEIVLFEGYDAGTADFGPFINKILESGAEAILGGGHFQDGSTFARQIYEKNVEIKFFTLLVAPPEPDFADLGDAAVGVIGPSQWEPLAEFTPESAAEAGLEWFGATGAEFVQAYEAAYDEEPSYHSMGGYAAGQILEKAIMDAGSTDTDAIKAAMEGMDILTGYGRVKFETSEDAHGLQIGHSMIYIQWQKDADGNLAKQVVWPLEGKTADPLYPKP
jgi:branched-chain amino acid transport system substrate-binding protein